MEFQRAFSHAVWESKVGYCRALRAGRHIYVTGTASVDESGEGVHAPGDAYGQARRCLELIERALKKLGADRGHVGRPCQAAPAAAAAAEIGPATCQSWCTAPMTAKSSAARHAIQSGVRIQASSTEFQRSFFSSTPRGCELPVCSNTRYEASGMSGTK